MVSASSATDPEISTITNWAIEVAPSASRLILTARMPAALDSSASSMLSEASWLCGANTSRNAAPTATPPAVAVPVAVPGVVLVAVPVRARWVLVVGHARRSPASGRVCRRRARSGVRVQCSRLVGVRGGVRGRQDRRVRR